MLQFAAYIDSQEMEGVLKDALRILASEDMKLRTRAVDDAEDDTEMAAKANAVSDIKCIYLKLLCLYFYFFRQKQL